MMPYSCSALWTRHRNYESETMDCDFSFDYDGFDRMMAFIALIVFLPCVWFMMLNGAVDWLLAFVIIGTTTTITVALVVPCIATTIEAWSSQWSRGCDMMSRIDLTEDIDDTQNQTDR